MQHLGRLATDDDVNCRYAMGFSLFFFSSSSTHSLENGVVYQTFYLIRNHNAKVFIIFVSLNEPLFRMKRQTTTKSSDSHTHFHININCILINKTLLFLSFFFQLSLQFWRSFCFSSCFINECFVSDHPLSNSDTHTISSLGASFFFALFISIQWALAVCLFRTSMHTITIYYWCLCNATMSNETGPYKIGNGRVVAQFTSHDAFMCLSVIFICFLFVIECERQRKRRNKNIHTQTMKIIRWMFNSSAGRS